MVAVPVYCSRCTYDLRGLSADSSCPECGLPIAQTLQHLIDPAASRMPRLRDPIGVGNALVWLVVCLACAMLLLMLQAALVWVGYIQPRQTGVLGMAAAHDLTLLSAIMALLGLWSVFKFNPSKGQRVNVAVRLDVIALGLGLVSWSLLTMVLWQRERYWAFAPVDVEHVSMIRLILHILMAMAGITVWVGMQRILFTIGKRSRAYRHAQGGRQGIRPMMAATAAIAVGSAVRLVGVVLLDVEPLAVMGTVIVWVSMLMLFIGMLYLLINAIWIRQALRYPPPKLETLLTPIR
jgi:hypothetical protein